MASGVRRCNDVLCTWPIRGIHVHYDYDDHNSVDLKSRIRHRHETPSLCLIWHFKTERLTKLRKISLNACNYIFYDLVQNRIKYVCIKITGFMNVP